MVTVGDEEAEDALRRCLAMGADRAIRVDGRSDADPFSVARALAEVVRAESPDLVLCGVQSPRRGPGGDRHRARRAARPAAGRGRHAASTRRGRRRKAVVDRELEGGLVDVVEVDTPAVLTIQTGINEPRYANLRAIKQAEQEEIDVRERRGRRAGYRVRRMFVPPRGEGAEMLDGEPAEIARTDRGDRQGAAGVSVLVVAEHLRGQVRDVTRELITAGARARGPVTVAVIARDPPRSSTPSTSKAWTRSCTCRSAADEFENDVYQAAVEALIADRQPSVTLLGFTVNSMGYGPAVAAKLGLGFASDVFGVTREGDAVVATRAFYGAKVNAELEFPGPESVAAAAAAHDLGRRPRGPAAPP